MMGDMQDLIVDLPDEICDLLDEEKIGALQWKNDRGIFTNKGYIYGKLAERNLPPSGRRPAGWRIPWWKIKILRR